jgi:hypothetical protein
MLARGHKKILNVCGAKNIDKTAPAEICSDDGSIISQKWWWRGRPATQEIVAENTRAGLREYSLERILPQPIAAHMIV